MLIKLQELQDLETLLKTPLLEEEKEKIMSKLIALRLKIANLRKNKK